MQNCVVSKFGFGRVIRSKPAASTLAALAIVLAPQASLADEGGVSFWAPGLYGSLAATPAVPGWSAAAVYYHTTVDAGAAKNFRIGGGVQGGLKADADIGFFNATYTLAQPILGAQAALGLTGVIGGMNAGVNATLTGPFGNTISGSRSDSVTGFGDLYPRLTMKWANGVHNVMLYAMGGLPVGAYDANRLANLGIGHWSLDGGAGYTYFDPQSGWEASGVLGFTYNFKNPSTDYQNGVDAHFDWAVSKFITKQVHVGAVGYLFQQISDDTGSGATLGGFRSRVYGVGPQIGYLFPAGGMQGYLNLKGYKEFGAENRPEGWNVWLTLAISPEPPKPTAAHIVRK